MSSESPVYISVFVCDDSAADRFLLGQRIQEQGGLYLAGAASTAFGAVQAIESTQPDVVILDHLDHDGDVSVVVGAIRRAVPSVKVVIHSALPADRIVGVTSGDAYVRKTSDPDSLWQAVHQVSVGDAGRPPKPSG
jgi:DNA-binding NarL/FixJ family response regulator